MTLALFGGMSASEDLTLLDSASSRSGEGASFRLTLKKEGTNPCQDDNEASPRVAHSRESHGSARRLGDFRTSGIRRPAGFERPGGLNPGFGRCAARGGPFSHALVQESRQGRGAYVRCIPRRHWPGQGVNLAESWRRPGFSSFLDRGRRWERGSGANSDDGGLGGGHTARNVCLTFGRSKGARNEPKNAHRQQIPFLEGFVAAFAEKAAVGRRAVTTRSDQ